MSTKWWYGHNEYNTRAEADQAVLDMRDLLDSQPNEYVSVTPVTQADNGGWLISDDAYTDSEILNLDTSGYYNVTNHFTGETFVGLAGTDVGAKISEGKRIYAQQYEVTLLREIRDHTPTNVDMSVYLD